MSKYDFSKYIGLKYKHKGKDFDGVDCLGIIQLIFKHERGIDLPDLSGMEHHPTLTKNEEGYYLNFVEEGMDVKWKLVRPPYKRFDVPVFYVGSRNSVVSHTGVFISDHQFIHIRENTDSMLSELDDYHKSKLYIVLRWIS